VMWQATGPEAQDDILHYSWNGAGGVRDRRAVAKALWRIGDLEPV
jgi:hypothetical protein